MATSILTTTPTSTNGTDPAPIAWYGRFQSSTPGFITGVRYYVTNTNLGDGRITSSFIRLFDSSGGTDDLAHELQNKAVTIAPTIGWQTFSFDTPVAMQANHTYAFGLDFAAATANIVYGYTSSWPMPTINENLTLEFIGFRSAAQHDGYPAGSSGTVNFFVDVITSSSAPLSVDVGSDANVVAGSTVNLHAQKTGGSGTITYQWTKQSGPAGTFTHATQQDTDFTPTGGDGVYVLRCLVTDDYQQVYDELTITVTEPTRHAFPTSVVEGTGWSYTGGSTVAVLADSDAQTYMTSMLNPSGQSLVLAMGDIDPPGPSVPLKCRLKADFINGTTGSLTATLYQGSTTLISSASATLTEGLSGQAIASEFELIFPSADLSTVTDWADLRIKLEVTSS
ncbi:MAG: DUF4082 domain-containing protein [Candidatus Saccharimonadaceae bacterium]